MTIIVHDNAYWLTERSWHWAWWMVPAVLARIHQAWTDMDTLDITCPVPGCTRCCVSHYGEGF